jgi:hypothetical protein
MRLSEPDVQLSCLRTIYAVIDIASANVIFIVEELPEVLFGFLSKEPLREICLQILASLFDDSVGLCNHKKGTG